MIAKVLNNFDSKTPSQEYNLPVIGKIFCQLDMIINSKEVSGKDEFDVIKIIDQDGGHKIYICNCWNSPGVAQLVHSSTVLRFEPA